MPFTKFGLSPAVLQGVKAMGYIEPTPVQLRTIPLMLAGRDVIGSAQTGTGKTAAFALPTLSQLGQPGKRVAGQPDPVPGPDTYSASHLPNLSFGGGSRIVSLKYVLMHEVGHYFGLPTQVAR